MSANLGVSNSGKLAGQITRVSRFLSRHLWFWPIFAALLLLIIGWWSRQRVTAAAKQQIAEQLHSLLEADVAALRIWLQAQEMNALGLAANERIRTGVIRILDCVDDPDITPADLALSPEMHELTRDLLPLLETHNYIDYSLFCADRRLRASLHPQLIGLQLPPEAAQFLDSVFAGQTAVSHPYPSTVLLPDAQGNLRAGLPTMFVVAPVTNTPNQVVGAIGFRIRPEQEFSQILSVARFGKTGEAYAFDATGTLLSETRFRDQLETMGLVPPGAGSILNVRIHDPGVNLAKGERPSEPRQQRPLTMAVSDAVRGQSGIDVEGHPDLRGVPVCSAWTWLPEYELGMAVQVDVAEAYLPLSLLRTAFQTLFGGLVGAGAMIFFLMVAVDRLQTSARRATVAARRLGQYVLDREIGAGANGRVYQAHHAMLRRPVAVKLLDPDRTNEAALSRFEREVQVTCQLTHPNTVVIYDYGRTPDDVFFYAMEYLDGVSLDELVKRYGPQPEGRVIHLLRQMCGSLAEAHAVGLIHRDIKPANIILTRRGAIPDVVKVLDFGLVKAIDSSLQIEASLSDGMVGTPLYLSPEGIRHPQRVDARSDLYSLGAVGYFLVTGQPLFDSTHLAEVLELQTSTLPAKPSVRLGRPIADDLERLLMQCLAKDPQDRPASAVQLDEQLGRCRSTNDWTPEQAEAWWRKERRPTTLRPAAPTQEKTLVIHPAGERPSPGERDTQDC